MFLHFYLHKNMCLIVHVSDLILWVFKSINHNSMITEYLVTHQNCKFRSSWQKFHWESQHCVILKKVSSLVISVALLCLVIVSDWHIAEWVLECRYSRSCTHSSYIVTITYSLLTVQSFWSSGSDKINCMHENKISIC